jgi:puromycin-sensitive aminopeptidase
MKMSTYLVALIVGPLEQTAAVDSLGVPITVVHVPGKANLATFALDVAKHAIEFFTEWFEIPYPADKLDMIALPDFAMGAMENLGCVTYREQALLVDPERASLAELQRVATVVNHEIAHMWFGDLVTMRWWDGIWLNEAFATLMEVHCGDAYRPEWDLWTDFGAKREAAMSIDALHATRPIEFPVGAPEEAEAMFDPLTYEKGCGVLRMLELYIGIDNFRAGIRNYLRKHSYGNTDTPDLWNALADASGEPVATIMSTWLHQGGFPLVHVADGDGSVTLTQEPFMYSSRVVKGTTSAIGLEWQIPVVTRSVGNQEGTKTLLSEIELTVDVRGGPVVVNAGGSGVFRVRYSARHLADLAARIEDLETIERFYLLSDAWASVIADRSELGDFLTLAQAIADDRDPDVWGQATGPLGFLGLAVPDSVTDDLASYVRALVAPAFGDLGWAPGPDESERVGQLRAQLLAALGTIGKDPEVRAECARAHREFLDDGVELEPQLAPAIVATVAASGGIEEYEAFLERYRHASTPQEEVRYLGALGGFKSEELAARTFELARTEIRVQDVPRLIVALLVNRVAGPPTWTRLTEHWDEITAKLPPTLTSRMAEGARVLCRDAEFADGVSEFLATHPIPSGQKSVEQTRERLGVNVAFAARLAATAGPVLVAATERLAK